jgi:hypothetical protein
VIYLVSSAAIGVYNFPMEAKAMTIEDRRRNGSDGPSDWTVIAENLRSDLIVDAMAVH